MGDKSDLHKTVISKGTCFTNLLSSYLSNFARTVSNVFQKKGQIKEESADLDVNWTWKHFLIIEDRAMNVNWIFIESIFDA